MLEKQINKLQNKICKNIKFINSGGCIQFAYYFSKRLNELKIEHKIVLTDYNKIILNYKKFNSVSHVMIFIKDIGYIDGEDIMNKVLNKGYIKTCKLTEKKLNNFRNNYEWNDQYNTNQNEKLEKLINKYIK